VQLSYSDNGRAYRLPTKKWLVEDAGRGNCGIFSFWTENMGKAKGATWTKQQKSAGTPKLPKAITEEISRSPRNFGNRSAEKRGEVVSGRERREINTGDQKNLKDLGEVLQMEASCGQKIANLRPSLAPRRKPQARSKGPMLSNNRGPKVGPADGLHCVELPRARRPHSVQTFAALLEESRRK